MWGIFIPGGVFSKASTSPGDKAQAFVQTKLGALLKQHLHPKADAQYGPVFCVLTERLAENAQLLHAFRKGADTREDDAVAFHHHRGILGDHRRDPLPSPSRGLRSGDFLFRNQV